MIEAPRRHDAEPVGIIAINHPAVAPHLEAAVRELAALGYSASLFPDFAAFEAACCKIPDADVLLISSGTPCRRETLLRFPGLRGVVYFGAGTESINIDEATELGIVVANGASVINSESMAEATVLLILALLYGLHRSETILRAGLPRPARPFASKLKGKTVGLIGFGRIAQAVVARLAHWGVDVLIHSRQGQAARLPPHARMVALESLLRSSDVVSIHASLNDETRHMIDAPRIAMMKPDAYLINTARGGLVDEGALYAALRDKRIAGAALDTFAAEPLPPDSRLRDLPNTILTPHMVGHTVEGAASMVAAAVENVARIARKEPPLYVRNPEVLPAWLRRWGRQ